MLTNSPKTAPTVTNESAFPVADVNVAASVVVLVVYLNSIIVKLPNMAGPNCVKPVPADGSVSPLPLLQIPTVRASCEEITILPDVMAFAPDPGED